MGNGSNPVAKAPKKKSPIVFPPSITKWINSVAGRVRNPFLRGFGVVNPLICFVTFALFFQYCGTNVGLERFDWDLVGSRVFSGLTNNLALKGSQQSPRAEMPGSADASGVEKKPEPNKTENAKKQTGSKNETPIDLLTKELSIRLFWAVSALIFGFFCFLVISQTLKIIVEALSLPFSSAFILSLAVLYFCIWGFAESRGPVAEIAGGEAGESLLRAVESERNPAFIRSQKTSQELPIKPLYPSIKKYKHRLVTVRDIAAWLAALSKIALCLVALACCFIVFQLRQITAKAIAEDEVKTATSQFEDCIDTWLRLLQLTAFALIAAVIQVYLLYYMCSFHASPAVGSNVQFYARAIAGTAGTVYSGMLLAIFLPLISEARDIRRKLLVVNRNVTEDAKEEKIRQAELDATNLGVVKTALTVLSPIVAAFLTNISSSMIELFSALGT